MSNQQQLNTRHMQLRVILEDKYKKFFPIPGQHKVKVVKKMGRVIVCETTINRKKVYFWQDSLNSVMVNNMDNLASEITEYQQSMNEKQKIEHVLIWSNPRMKACKFDMIDVIVDDLSENS